MEYISKSQARKIAVNASWKPEGNGRGKQATLQTVQHLGYVQIDTISVIERAHHHVFWSRQGDYKPDYLNTLLAEDRAVFEHWAHAAAYIPIEDYRYYIPKMEGFRKPPTGKRRREVYNSVQPLFKTILKRIRDEGGLASKDFKQVRERTSEGWWDWKPAKVALEYLYLRGDLMVSARRNFQRVYDLAERVLPADLPATQPSPKECAEFQIRRSLNAMGIARESEMAKHIQVCDRKDLKNNLKEQVESGDLLEVGIREVDGEVYYAHPETLDRLSSLKSPRQVRIVSPFDNLVIQRERMSLLFDFDYTIECYVPAPKRKYGYFVCPVLWGPNLVARIDMKADRKSKQLLVNHLHGEPGLKSGKRFDSLLSKALESFAVFNGCAVVKR